MHTEHHGIVTKWTSVVHLGHCVSTAPREPRVAAGHYDNARARCYQAHLTRTCSAASAVDDCAATSAPAADVGDVDPFGRATASIGGIVGIIVVTGVKSTLKRFAVCAPRLWHMARSNCSRANSGVVRTDPLRFLVGCRTRRLNLCRLCLSWLLI